MICAYRTYGAIRFFALQIQSVPARAPGLTWPDVPRDVPMEFVLAMFVNFPFKRSMSSNVTDNCRI